MHYLITGHTGFKGAWLTLWLNFLGHKVSGIALDPLEGSLFKLANISELMENDLRVDIRNADETISAIQDISPDVVFHLAAQPLVRQSYKEPRETFETNVMGTLNVIEGVTKTPSIRAHVVITTDKVYRNVNQEKGYVESDPLGGEDPYSASKAMADILTQSWVASFDGPPTAVVRAGNVIGGGDVSPDRLLPDLINAYENNRVPVLRYPNSVRPWQHVLDCLNGYLAVSEALMVNVVIGEINIGPGKESFVTVGDVASQVANLYGVKTTWNIETSEQVHEAGLLSLDASKAQKLLNWEEKLKFSESIEWTVHWHQNLKQGKDAKRLTLDQINKFLNI
jgi:CDP-glucose 4,6-dehydratase